MACHDLVATPDLKQKVISTILSVLVGYVSKKIVFGDKKNLVKDVLGSFLQIGVTKMVSAKTEGLMAVVASLIKNFKSLKSNI
jgi:putative flippase GtrA